MATLQRSAVSFSRQGSSGMVWDDNHVLGEDGMVQFRKLRPWQSTRQRGSSSSPGVPISCPRSLSTPANQKELSLQVLRMLSFLMRFSRLSRNLNR
ncbi:hypothetical protein SLEP1_g49531 [Rubroshorea leprosula]|uniref:Uncharacterized protein n=1 Tax=Rubroshorea leprosula TaxID=152421 RepID=A0AAV5LZL7_9ROSI|nr:hypothetical protein SLEP1_g49531 [Rubroshorea leprosula]